jgi:hypothetical protein
MFKRFTSHTLMALAEASLVALLVVGLIAGTAFAGKGGKGGGKPPTGSGSTAGNLTLAMVEDLNGNTAPNWGDTITFQVATTATDRPFVGVKCYQGSLVYSGSVGYFDDYPWVQTFRLSSSYWTGGAANCDARLYEMRSNGSTTTLGTMSFVAEG